MTNFRIIETSNPYPDVLLHRDIDCDNNEIVEIKAFGVVDKIENMWASDVIIFESAFLACRYIEDFSKKSADDWCESHNICFQ